jgi:hypothetical membrane protein
LPEHIALTSTTGTSSIKKPSGINAYHLVAWSVLFFLVFIVTVHLAASSTYSLIDNTVSDLSCQGYGRAWIMRVGLWGIGLLIALCMGLLITRRTKFMVADITLLLYGAAIFLTGVFLNSN